MRKPIKQRAQERPVTLAGIIVGVLMFAVTMTLGEAHAASLEPWLILIAPFVAAFITERFTFSKVFMAYVVDYLTDGNPVPAPIQQRDNRIGRQGVKVRRPDTNGPRPRDRGLTALEAVVVILVVIVVLLLLLPRLGR